MGDYFNHWLKIGHRLEHTPRIFTVNWFRQDAGGKFLWPGFGENSRVLKWIFERLDGNAQAKATPIGHVPTPESLDLSGLSLSSAQLDVLLSVDPVVWREEAGLIPDAYERFATRLPDALWQELDALNQRLTA